MVSKFGLFVLIFAPLDIIIGIGTAIIGITAWGIVVPLCFLGWQLGVFNSVFLSFFMDFIDSLYSFTMLMIFIKRKNRRAKELNNKNIEQIDLRLGPALRFIPVIIGATLLGLFLAKDYLKSYTSFLEGGIGYFMLVFAAAFFYKAFRARYVRLHPKNTSNLTPLRLTAINSDQSHQDNDLAVLSIDHQNDYLNLESDSDSNLDQENKNESKDESKNEIKNDSLDDPKNEYKIKYELSFSKNDENDDQITSDETRQQNQIFDQNSLNEGLIRNKKPSKKYRYFMEFLRHFIVILLIFPWGMIGGFIGFGVGLIFSVIIMTAFKLPTISGVINGNLLSATLTGLGFFFYIGFDLVDWSLMYPYMLVSILFSMIGTSIGIFFASFFSKEKLFFLMATILVICSIISIIIPYVNR
ncbi:membrane transporter protein [Anaeramoeba ignava]|uniref:Membrane transporter protein n=1 Tax=Anaeramoeba ignava TaxID=1746090 RepID=A0A9Q0LVS0_ANAIG|nr:membrane transporter protein [Anaeramoeba ignava]|eukprot:Anaeramoba_ignava/a93714_55.p1 GENE.a93714_55~~a93714_55.p1  ORF type:complete len:437 (-),score=88.29 a93714_55:62-1297(-)